MPNRRPFDLILLGATGFTGRLVAEYLLKAYGLEGKLKWAIAGRNLDKLQRVRGELGEERIPLLHADSLDPASLDALTVQTKVLCTTVGPYAKYGSETVASCVRNGTHYCDLAGEVPWMRRMIDAHHEEANAKKLRIVHTCGYDSIPSDMGVYFLQKKAMDTRGAYCTHIKAGVRASKGGFSGGTVASLVNVVEEAEQDKRIYGLMADPYSLNPAEMREGPDQRDLRSVVFDEDFQRWKAPFVMSFINTRVVRRGHALRGRPYGEDFRYEEFMLSGTGLSGRLTGYAMALPMALMRQIKPGTLARKLFDRITPDPGQGPDKEARESGFWIFDLIGLLPDGEKLYARVKGQGDPGYKSTSQMLAESAICLAKDELPAQYGVTTPATAMGDALLQRLQDNAGLSFRLKEG